MMEGSSSSSAVGTSNTMSEEEIEVIVPKSRGKNWPHMKILCTEHSNVVAMILRAVYDCKCTTELNATHNDYPKGNNWSWLYDHLFGGGSEGHRLLAGHLPLLPTASKLQIKVMDIWAHLKKESTKKENIKVDMDFVQTALQQEMEYEDAKAQEKAAIDNKAKNKDELVQKQMRSFEVGRGALPPGAKGTVGAGCHEHSTNLHTNQPATYSFANFATKLGRPPDIINNMTPPPPKKKAKCSSATVHGIHMAQLKELRVSLSTGMEKLMGVDNDNERKLYERQVALEKSIAFYEKYPGNEKMQKKMEEASEAHMAITDKITALTK
jgi:hypothetical protein